MVIGRCDLKNALYSNSQVTLYAYELSNLEFLMKSSWIAAGVVVLTLILWMLSGLLISDEPSSDETLSSEDQPVMSVEVMLAKTSLMTRELDLQGQIEPVRQVLVKAQTHGQVEDIIVNKGARVSSDQPLIKLDEGGRRNTQAEVKAAVKTARSEQQAAQTLQRQRLQSKLQLEQADAALEAALARLASVELDIEYTTVRAPFDGVINALPVALGALIERGDVIAELIDDSTFKVSAHVAQQVLSQLRVGQKVSVSLITGESLSGTISFIGSAAEPQTRSFIVEALVQNPSNSIAAGVSATLSIPVEEVEATFITPSALSLGDNGTLGVKVLDDNDRVLFTPIELVSTTLDGAWVTGIPNQSRVVTLGQGFVNVGEKVRAQLAGETSDQLD